MCGLPLAIQLEIKSDQIPCVLIFFLGDVNYCFHFYAFINFNESVFSMSVKCKIMMENFEIDVSASQIFSISGGKLSHFSDESNIFISNFDLFFVQYAKF